MENLKRAFINIFDNAIRYSPTKEGIQIEIFNHVENIFNENEFLNQKLSNFFEVAFTLLSKCSNMPFKLLSSCLQMAFELLPNSLQLAF